MRKVYRKRGRPPKREVKERLFRILKEARIGTTYRLKKLYGKRFKDRVSWNTVKKYLELLTEEGKIKRQAVIPRSNGEKTVVYLLR